jgi:S1-C subfamily serine protease
MSADHKPDAEEPKIVPGVPGRAFVPFDTIGGPIQECVLPLVAIVDDVVYPVGTAFAIHPEGILMTAAHVLEYAASFARPIRRADGTTYLHYELYALYMSDQQSSPLALFGGPLPVDKVWAAAEHDVAVTLARLPYNAETRQKLRLRTARLRPRPPKVGDHIAAFGYRAMEASRILERRVTYKQETAISTATVTEVFDETRDRGAANFPCFHVDARFDHGMSGGPIFEESGAVCGIVSRGMFPDLSLGASLWPALGMSIDISIDDQPMTITLYELARRRMLDVDASFESVSLTESGVSIRY